MTTLADQLDAARKEAAKAQEALQLKQSEFDAAVAEQRFSDAERLKVELPPLQQAYALAEARGRALSDVLDQLAADQAERDRQAADAARRRQAGEQRDAALAAEQHALADLQRHLADVEPGIAAVRQSLLAAVAAERAASQARQDAHAAQVVLGEAHPNFTVARVNTATARIEASRLLGAIFHGGRL